MIALLIFYYRSCCISVGGGGGCDIDRSYWDDEDDNSDASYVPSSEPQSSEEEEDDDSKAYKRRSKTKSKPRSHSMKKQKLPSDTQKCEKQLSEETIKRLLDMTIEESQKKHNLTLSLQVLDKSYADILSGSEERTLEQYVKTIQEDVHIIKKLDVHRMSVYQNIGARLQQLHEGQWQRLSDAQKKEHGLKKFIHFLKADSPVGAGLQVISDGRDWLYRTIYQCCRLHSALPFLPLVWERELTIEGLAHVIKPIKDYLKSKAAQQGRNALHRL